MEAVFLSAALPALDLDLGIYLPLTLTFASWPDRKANAATMADTSLAAPLTRDLPLNNALMTGPSGAVDASLRTIPLGTDQPGSPASHPARGLRADHHGCTVRQGQSHRLPPFARARDVIRWAIPSQPEHSAIADLIQLIYSSQPFGYDGATLDGILLDARRCNARDGVTGALICRQDVYLQLLEGPGRAVEGAYARIARDDRHLDPRIHLKTPTGTRLFGDWAMLHDPATTWIWTQAQIEEGALDRATDRDIRAVFETLAAANPPA